MKHMLVALLLGIQGHAVIAMGDQPRQPAAKPLTKKKHGTDQVCLAMETALLDQHVFGPDQYALGNRPLATHSDKRLTTVQQRFCARSKWDDFQRWVDPQEQKSAFASPADMANFLIRGAEQLKSEIDSPEAERILPLLRNVWATIRAAIPDEQAPNHPELAGLAQYTQQECDRLLHVAITSSAPVPPPIDAPPANADDAPGLNQAPLVPHHENVPPITPESGDIYQEFENIHHWLHPDNAGHATLAADVVTQLLIEGAQKVCRLAQMARMDEPVPTVENNFERWYIRLKLQFDALGPGQRTNQQLNEAFAQMDSEVDAHRQAIAQHKMKIRAQTRAQKFKVLSTCTIAYFAAIIVYTIWTYTTGQKVPTRPKSESSS